MSSEPTVRLLAIGIPTFNRSRKLLRLVAALSAQIRDAGRAQDVAIFVSDNCSADDTPGVVAQFTRENPDIIVQYRRHDRNVGAVRNIASVYRDCGARHVWFFADDDLPLSGAVAKVFEVLESERPDVLAMAFEQPPGTPNYILPPRDRRLVTTDGRDAARLLCTTYATKLSALVLRVREFSPESEAKIAEALEEHGWIHTVLALSVLNDTEGWTLAAVNEPLASSDDDYRVLRTPASDWARIGKVVTHPFVTRNATEVASMQERLSCYTEIGVLWGWRTGHYEVAPEYEAEYWKALNALRPRWGLLARNPPMGLAYLVLRLAPRSGPRVVSATARVLRRPLARPASADARGGAASTSGRLGGGERP